MEERRGSACMLAATFSSSVDPWPYIDYMKCNASSDSDLVVAETQINHALEPESDQVSPPSSSKNLKGGSARSIGSCLVL